MFVLIISNTGGPAFAFGPYGNEAEAMSDGDVFLGSNNKDGDETPFAIHVLALESQVDN